MHQRALRYADYAVLCRDGWFVSVGECGAGVLIRELPDIRRPAISSTQVLNFFLS